MDACTPFGMKEATGQYAFRAMAWQHAYFSVHTLRVVYRAREHMLLNALDSIRRGDFDSLAVRELLAHTSRSRAPRDGVEPVNLYAVKKVVAEDN